MNEARIQNAIWSDRGRQAMLVCPNYTPAGWWECDMWLVTKNGYAVEFEIKVSLQDLKADAQKASSNKWVRDTTDATGWRQNGNECKHDLLAARDKRGPSRFFYVVPETLGVTAGDVPEWAGLIQARTIEGYRALQLWEERPAPKLHTTMVDPKIIEHCRSVFYWRYWNIRGRSSSEKFLTERPESAESGQITGDLPEILQAQDT